MSRLTLLVLLLLASGLGYLAWTTLQTQQEDPEAGALSRRVFHGVDKEQVTAMRLDHLERNTALRIEKEEGGGWQLVDPIISSASAGAVKELLDLIADLRGSEVPAGEGSREEFLESVQLSPPRAEFEIEWIANGKTSSRLIELGAIDLDARSLLIHDVESGRVLRTLRTIDTALLRGVSEFRDPIVMRLQAERVVEFHRTGTESFDSKRFGIELHAFQENDGWVAASPSITDLHPGAMQLLISNTARLRARSWLTADRAKELSESTIFDPPALRLDARYANEEAMILEIGRTGNGRWLARDLAFPDRIAELEEESAFRLSVPFELLADLRLLRAPLPLIERITFERTPERGDLLVFERDAEGWQVIDSAGTERRADRVAVRDLLGEFERTLFHDLSPDPAWPADEVQASLRFEGAGETWRIDVGGSAALEERQPGGEILQLDEPGVRVRRAGEELVFVAKRELLDLLLRPTLDGFTNLDLIRVQELEVAAIELRGEGRELRWTRSDRGRWTREGEEKEAFEILSILDALFLQRAEAPLPQSTPLDSRVELSILGQQGELANYALGEVIYEGETRLALAQGEEFWLLPKLRSALHEQLLRILRAN